MFFILRLLFYVSFVRFNNIYKKGIFDGKLRNMKKENNITDPRLLAIGKQIKQLRIEKGYSSAEIFAYEHNLNRISYWRMEKGTNITINSLLKVLDIHKISMNKFFSSILD